MAFRRRIAATLLNGSVRGRLECVCYGVVLSGICACWQCGAKRCRLQCFWRLHAKWPYTASFGALSVAGNIPSALTTFGHGISLYPNNALLQESYRMAFQSQPQMPVETGVAGRAEMVEGVDAPVKPAAMNDYYKAVSCLCRKDFPKALKLYGQALKSDSRNKYLLKGYRDAVLGWFKAAAYCNDAQMSVLCHNAGTRFFKAKDFFAAFNAFGQALQLDPTSGTLLQSFRKAVLFYTCSLPPEMTALLYNQVPGPIPAAAVPHYVKGITHYVALEFLPSMRSFSAALRRDPTNNEILFYMRSARQAQ